MKTRWIVLFVCLVVGMMVGCSSRESATTTNTPPADTTRPDAEVKGATIDLYEGERVTMHIIADKIVRFEQIDSTMGYKVHADFLDTAGTVSSHLDGDSAVIHETSRHLYVFGHVVVISKDQSKLETDYLHWNPELRKIQTDAFVKVTRRGDVATGWGLEADDSLTRVRILKQVSATIHNSDEAEEPVDSTSGQ